MGFFNRFFRKSPPSLPCPMAMGMSYESRSQHEKVYTEVLGAFSTVLHPLDGRLPHVCVYRIDPQGERDMVTYITSGMSEVFQPGMEGQDMSRIELLFYAKEHSRVYSEMLLEFSGYPGGTGVPLLPYDCVPLRHYGGQVLGHSRFNGLWFCPMTAKMDRPLVPRMKTKGDNVFPLLIMPLLPEETDFHEKEGGESLMQAVPRFRPAGRVFSGPAGICLMAARVTSSPGPPSRSRRPPPSLPRSSCPVRRPAWRC